MTKRSRLLGCLCFLLGALAWQITPEADFALAKESNGCSTSECHPTLTKKTPVAPKGHEDCTHCHLIGSNNIEQHPKQGIISFSLAQDTCQECHQPILDYDFLHPPVAAGDCQACHAFHSSSTSLLKDNQEQSLCYRCHQPVTKKGNTVLHGDVANNKCTSCHTAHGSFFKHLLAGTYSTDFFNDYNEKQYALCFQCHKIDLLLHPYTSYNTNFRDGKKNLHYIHVNRSSRGRACKLCHEIHSSHEPKLMADTVTFGGWEMPINFIISDTGGQCTPGCHAQTKYDRNALSAPGASAQEASSATNTGEPPP